MPHKPRDEEREERITMEIIVDAYDAEEQAMGWYYYLDGKLQFPFTARCVTQRAISPLNVGEEVKVVGMAPIEECDHEMFMMIKWKSRTFGVPLIALQGVDVDEETQEAMEDWHYWVGGDEDDE
ncbi:MAG TPA: calcium-binding protein [Ktedonobacteraceae bacterium]|nr:calcium-binding protein [Ktedonobacteraceae bacterium]